MDHRPAAEGVLPRLKMKPRRRELSVKVGNLHSVRDLSDVQDVVRAYVLALHKGRPGEAYNVGSSQGTSVRELFELVRREAGIEVRLEGEPSRMRATDIPYLVADTQKTSMELGRELEVPLEKTIRDMLDAAIRIPARYRQE